MNGMIGSTLLDDLLAMQGDFNRLLRSGWYGRNRIEYPPVNVWTSEGGAVVDAELPGADPNEVEVAVLGNEMTISGRVGTADGKPAGNEKEGYLRRERPYGEFARTVRLPFKCEPGRTAAAYKNGVLRITAPRAEADKPRKIAIQTE